MGVHTLESHLINVNKLCRVCGKRAKKYNDRRETAKDCKYYGKQILYYYGIDTESDNPLTHSTKICEQCYSATVIFTIIHRSKLFHIIS